MKLRNADVFATICVGIALRAVVSLHSYSGKSTPPLYGDYEAQRHWQEITTNLSPKEWYINTTRNDLLYWGLDYPPLTAYHSYLMGIVGKSVNQSFVALEESRGIESGPHKSFMRLTVLFADILLYLPGTFTLCVALKKAYQASSILMCLVPIVIYPGQILIDNGHFQYNNVSLGLTALAIAAILNASFLWAAMLFVLALNYKQMELYHALPFFVYLLRVCFEQERFPQKMAKLLEIASIVIATFTILWMPWLQSTTSIINVIGRLFPLARGVFEDKVANFWCVLNVVYKLKRNFSNSQMALLCLGTTVIAVIPVNVHLFTKANKETFLKSLTSTAMGFFLFSFQVHEKSILLVTLPACCLFASKPLEVFWFLEVSVFSMVPLFIKDGLVMPFLLILFIYHICVKCILLSHMFKNSNHTLSKYVSGSTCAIYILTIMSVVVPAPPRYPDLWSLIISVYSFFHFILFFTFVIISQFKTSLSTSIQINK